MLGNEWFLLVNDLVNTQVCVEVGLDLLEDDHGTVSAGAARIRSAMIYDVLAIV